jgi:hypothetical protein
LVPRAAPGAERKISSRAWAREALGLRRPRGKLNRFLRFPLPVQGIFHLCSNFAGLPGGGIPVQPPQPGVRVSVAAKARSQAFLLPFLGEVQEVKGAVSQGARVPPLALPSPRMPSFGARRGREEKPPA